MYGNITSHLYVFEEPLRLLKFRSHHSKVRGLGGPEMPAIWPAWPRARTNWRSSTGSPGLRGSAPRALKGSEGRELTRHHPKLALGQQPGPGVAPRQWPLSICPPTSVPNWGQVVPSLPSSCSARGCRQPGVNSQSHRGPTFSPESRPPQPLPPRRGGGDRLHAGRPAPRLAIAHKS